MSQSLSSARYHPSLPSTLMFVSWGIRFGVFQSVALGFVCMCKGCSGLGASRVGYVIRVQGNPLVPDDLRAVAASSAAQVCVVSDTSRYVCSLLLENLSSPAPFSAELGPHLHDSHRHHMRLSLKTFTYFEVHDCVRDNRHIVLLVA